MVEGCKRDHHRRRKRRKSDITRNRSLKLASVKREQESRATRTRRRINGGSLSSHGSATSMQCGLCAVLASLFRRAMCIAGSRRGSGESCYQELTCETQQQQQVENKDITTITTTTTTTNVEEKNTCDVVVSVVQSTPEKTTSSSPSVAQKNLKNLDDYHETANAEVTVDSSEQNAVFVRISEDATLPASGSSPSTSGLDNEKYQRRYSDTDRLLIENIDNKINDRIRNGSRFLTMHKRRRKRLTTRSLNQDPGLLDDIFHGQVQCVLQRAGHWRFNAFTLETVSGGRSLPVLCVHLFQWYGLLQQFNLDVVRVWKLFALIEEGYHSTNPYHNSIHATDVTQAMHCFLQEEKIRKHLTSLEVMASLIAAVTHDLDHPGVNQPFLVATSNHLAKLYENTSVLENHHWRSAIACLLESGVSDQLSPEIRPELQHYISSLILATDITRQQEFLTKFKSYQDKNILDMKKSEYRHFILQISLKCADISNPCRQWDISKKWSQKVCEEFFRQGDYERQLNLPVTPLCDRNTISIPKIQVGFFQFVVTPLYNEWHRFLGDGLSIVLMKNLKINQKKWESLIAQDTIDDNNKTDMSDVEEALNSPSSDDDDDDDENNNSDNNNTLQEEEYCEDDEEEEESFVDKKSAKIQKSQSLSASSSVAGVSILPSSSSSSNRRSSLPCNYDKKLTGRRHSVPMSIKTSSSPQKSLLNPSNIQTDYDNNKKQQHQPPLVKLDNQSFNKLSTLSLLSSHSSLIDSITNTSTTERPVSAENLLPETSIASITSDIEASKLSNILQSSQSKQLTRQQTFPPLQPYIRVRYLSTTAEMSKCKTDTLHEAESPHSSTNSSPSRERTSTAAAAATSRVQLSTTSDKRERKISTRSYTIDNTGRRRESAYADFNRLNVDTGFVGDERRRHSVQGVRSDELPLSRHHRHRHHHHHNPPLHHHHHHQHHHNYKRPSSAQETDPTQVFYATLTGVTTFKHKSIGSDSAQISQSDSERQWSLEESTVEEQQSPDQFMPLPDENPGKSKETEGHRRFSTPVSEGKSGGFVGCDSGRRFTMIPVASELPSQKVFFIGSPPESPPRLKSVSSSSDSGSEQRQSIGETCSEPISYYKGSKIQKLSDDGGMKENVDPRVIADDTGKSITTRRINQGWARRRGSAPVGLMFRLDDGPLSVTSRIERHMRRGSVPADIANHQTLTSGGSFRSALGTRGENKTSPRRASLPPESGFGNIFGNIFSTTDERENYPMNYNRNNNNNNNNNGNQGMPSPRRGSVPADISELRRDLFGRNSINGKTATTTTTTRNRKKILRRRSSGGPEMFKLLTNTDDNDYTKLSGWKRELTMRDSIPEPSVKRRGSLPVEMLSISHTGIGGGGGGGAAGSGAGGISARRSSLWRL